MILKIRIFLLVINERIVPAVIHNYLIKILNYFTLPKLDYRFKKLKLSQQCLYKLLNDFEFETILDVGAGSCEHAELMEEYGKNVTALDLGKSIYYKDKKNNLKVLRKNFFDYEPKNKFDALWASPIFEHQPECGLFSRKISKIVKPNGLIAITVPPPTTMILGGHLNSFNAGYLMYHLVINGINCKNCSILRDGYNVSTIVRNVSISPKDLSMDNGDIDRLRLFFPKFVKEPFNGNIRKWNW